MNPKDQNKRLPLLEAQRRHLNLLTPEERAAHDRQQIGKTLAWCEYLRRVRGPGKPQRGDDSYPPWSFADDPGLALLPGEEFPRSFWNRTPRPASTEQQLSTAASI